MSAEPLTYRSMQWILQLMQTIRINAGFHTDLGANVSLTPVNLDDDYDALPAAHVITAQDDISLEGTSQRNKRIRLPVLVEAYIYALASQGPLLAHRVFNDLIDIFPPQQAPRIAAPAGVLGIEQDFVRIITQPEGLPYIVVQAGLFIELSEPVHHPVTP